MPAPRKITDEQREVIRQVAEARIAARAIPSDKQLSRMLGLPVRSIRWIASLMTVSRGTHKCELMQDGSSRPDRI